MGTSRVVVSNLNERENLEDQDTGYSCERKVVTVCQDITDLLDERVRTDATRIIFSKTIDLIPHNRLLKRIVANGVNLRVYIYIYIEGVPGGMDRTSGECSLR